MRAAGANLGRRPPMPCGRGGGRRGRRRRIARDLRTGRRHFPRGAGRDEPREAQATGATATGGPQGGAPTVERSAPARPHDAAGLAKRDGILWMPTGAVARALSAGHRPGGARLRGGKEEHGAVLVAEASAAVRSEANRETVCPTERRRGAFASGLLVAGLARLQLAHPLRKQTDDGDEGA